jgi:hypothetical protein
MIVTLSRAGKKAGAAFERLRSRRQSTGAQQNLTAGDWLFDILGSGVANIRP